MKRSVRKRFVGMGAPTPMTARTTVVPDAVPRTQSTDLARALDADGIFHGAPAIVGTVDTSAWTLVSDLSAGEPPRFARAVSAASTVTGPWSPVGSNGSGDGAINNAVTALAVSGSDLYVDGIFTDAAGVATADHVAEWNGSTWSALGSNGSGEGALDGAVSALAVSGSNLYVGGYFTNAGGIATADYVAEWNGSAWSALVAVGFDNGPSNYHVGALALTTRDVYVGGFFTNAAGVLEPDRVARWSPGSTVVRKPGGRIRLGSGAFVGNNIYNTTGTNQSRTGSVTPGHTVTFGISIQNDGTGGPDSFIVSGAGAAAAGYAVTYFHGTTDITAAVVGGTYETWSLAPGATYLITAKAKATSSAPVGSKVTRLVTISSVGDGTNQDAVTFVVKRS